MSALADMDADIAELRSLLGSAERARVKELLQREIASLEQGARSSQDVPTAAQPQQGSESPAPPVVEAPSASNGSGSTAPSAVPLVPAAAPVLLQTQKAPPQRSYTTVPSFSWDQDNDKVKIYFFLEGATKEGVELDVKPHSVDVRMHDVGAPGKNLRFGVPKLFGAVDPNSSRVIVKPSRVTVVLPKKVKGHWTDLQQKEDKLKPKMDANKDPMGGIMDLMKNMYDEGDEDMKRTIAKAWSDARSGKSNDPMMPTF